MVDRSTLFIDSIALEYPKSAEWSGVEVSQRSQEGVDTLTLFDSIDRGPTNLFANDNDTTLVTYSCTSFPDAFPLSSCSSHPLFAIVLRLSCEPCQGTHFDPRFN